MTPANPKTRLIGLSMVGVALGMVLSACATSSSSQPLPQYVTPTDGKNFGGDAVVSMTTNTAGHRYLFRRDNPPVALRQSSSDLVAAVPQLVGLQATALPSTADAAAVSLVEDSPHAKVWGSLLDQGKRAVFEAYAKHKSWGAWLILVTDVVVHGVADPVPPTAYRWTRAEVEQFVSCGVPQSGVNDCSKAFYLTGDQVQLTGPGNVGHGQ